MQPAAAAGGRLVRMLVIALAVVLAGVSGSRSQSASAGEPEVVWTTVGIPDRLQPAMGYDPTRQRVVVYGGVGDGGRALNDMWSWDGASWTQLSTGASPPTPYGSAMAFDDANGSALLFDPHGSTWTWDGAAWTRHYPAPGTSPPSGLLYAAMTYDPGTGTYVLFGGATDYGHGPLSDETWSWDGLDWTEQEPSASPPVGAALMAYDAATSTVVLTLGSDSPRTTTTWTWDGTTWTEQHPTTSPPPLFQASMGYDPANNAVVLFLTDESSHRDETWTWDGSSWTLLDPATSPPARGGAGMAFDAARGEVLLFGGEETAYDASGNLVDLGVGGDLWAWDGTTWTELSAGNPPDRWRAALAYDAATGSTVLFGGGLDDTWTWDGSSWTRQAPATSPPWRYDAAMTYDEARQQVVLFGGIAADVLGDTWTWDGTTWTEQQPTTSPPPLFGASMAYDAATRTTVLFGGEMVDTASGGYKPSGMTWTWDGTNWALQQPTTSPPPLGYSSMAYDPVRSQIVLFGGVGASLSGDTWTWDGTTWTKQAPTASPLPREAASLAFDPALGAVVLFGGTVIWNGVPAPCDNTGTVGGAPVCGDTWVWDGTTWSRLSPATAPYPREWGAMAYDAEGNQILFGGNVSYPSGGTSRHRQAAAESQASGDTDTWKLPPPAGSSRLFVLAQGEGRGTVTSDPPGIACELACSYDFASGAPVTLTARAAPPAKFSGWSGAGCSGIGVCEVAMSSFRLVTATFDACGVPRLTGMRLAAAKRALRNNHCSLGRVKKAHSRKKKGIVLRQHVAAGKTLAPGSRVNVVVSKGRKR